MTKLVAMLILCGVLNVQAQAEYPHTRLFRKAEADPVWAAADPRQKMNLLVEVAMKESVTSDPVSDRYTLTFLGGPIDWVHFFNLANFVYTGHRTWRESLFEQWEKEGGVAFERGLGRQNPSAATPDDLPSNALGALFGEELRLAGEGVDFQDAFQKFIEPLQPVPTAISGKFSHHEVVLGLSREPARDELNRAFAWFTAEPLNLTVKINAAAPAAFAPVAASGKAALARAGFQVTGYRGKMIVIERLKGK